MHFCDNYIIALILINVNTLFRIYAIYFFIFKKIVAIVQLL
nr:MAG TPA: hypothetical protein [Caudoviricetes sp.]